MTTDIVAMAKRLGGEIVSGAISCPGPGHSALDRSLRVFVDPDAENGFKVTSFAEDDWRACRDHVDHLLGFDPWQPARGRSVRPLPRPPKKAATEAHDYTANAIAIYREARRIDGTIAATYLSKRIGCAITPPAFLRFHPRCPRLDQRLPALVALLRDAITDKPHAIQRIFLKDDGTDRLRDQMGKATLGPAKGTVCKLCRDDAVTLGLGIAEGIEKALALIAAGWSPIWATCGVGVMGKFPVLGGIEALTIFADHDDAGPRAAEQCATRWSDAGRSVRIVTPKLDGDWSDALAEVSP